MADDLTSKVTLVIKDESGNIIETADQTEELSSIITNTASTTFQEITASGDDSGDDKYKVYISANDSEKHTGYSANYVNLIKYKNDLLIVYSKNTKISSLTRNVIGIGKIQFVGTIDSDISAGESLFKIGYPATVPLEITIGSDSDVGASSSEEKVEDNVVTYFDVIATKAISAGSFTLTINAKIDYRQLSHIYSSSNAAIINDGAADNPAVETYSRGYLDAQFARISYVSSLIDRLGSTYLKRNEALNFSNTVKITSTVNSSLYGLTTDCYAKSFFGSAVHIVGARSSSDSGLLDESSGNYLIVAEKYKTETLSSGTVTRNVPDLENGSYIHITPTGLDVHTLEPSTPGLRITATNTDKTTDIMDVYGNKIIARKSDTTGAPIYLNISNENNRNIASDKPVYTTLIDTLELDSRDVVVSDELKTKNGGLSVTQSKINTSLPMASSSEVKAATLKATGVLYSEKSTTLEGGTKITNSSNVNNNQLIIDVDNTTFKGKNTTFKTGAKFDGETITVTQDTTLEFEGDDNSKATISYDSSKKKWVIKGFKVYGAVWNS